MSVEEHNQRVRERWASEKKPVITGVPVQVYRMNVFCPNDNEPLVFNGNILLTYPAKYPHSCRECGYTVNLEASYPKLEYR